MFSWSAFTFNEASHPGDSAQDQASHGVSEKPRNDGLEGRASVLPSIEGTLRELYFFLLKHLLSLLCSTVGDIGEFYPTAITRG
jgi:hypothetical protein